MNARMSTCQIHCSRKIAGDGQYGPAQGDSPNQHFIAQIPSMHENNFSKLTVY